MIGAAECNAKGIIINPLGEGQTPSGNSVRSNEGLSRFVKAHSSFALTKHKCEDDCIFLAKAFVNYSVI